MARILRSYDHRLRELVRSTGDLGHATRRGVPRSTARGWLTPARAEVVTVDIVDMAVADLQQEVLVLRARVERLVALLRLVVVLLKVSGFSLACARLPDGATKISLLRAIERSRSALPLRTVLRVLRLSQSRYHSWKREEECGLDDMPSCPRSSPQQLTRSEIEAIKEMVTSEEYRHAIRHDILHFRARVLATRAAYRPGRGRHVRGRGRCSRWPVFDQAQLCSRGFLDNRATHPRGSL